MSQSNWVSKLREAAPKSNFLRGTSILVVGNIIAQSLVLLSSPLLTRIYSPAEFGLLAVFGATTAIAGSIVCGRYEAAVALPDTERETVSVIAGAILVAAIMAPLTSLLFLATPWATLLIHEGYSIAFILVTVTLGTILAGLCATYRYWGIKQKNYTLIARSRILQSITRVVTQCGFFFGGATTLILGTVAAALVGFVTLHRGVQKPVRSSSAEILTAINRYRRFPLYSTWSTALNMGGKQLPIFAFVTLFGVGPAGLYSLAERVIAAPVSLVTSAFSAMFLSESVTSKQNRTLTALVGQTHKLLTNIAIAPFLMLAITAPALFPMLFGEKWAEAGTIASWISLYLYLSFVAAPMTMLFRTLERQDVELKIQCSLFAGRLVAVFLGAKLGGFIFSVAFYSIVSAIYYIYILAWVSNSVDLDPMILIRQTCNSLGWALLTTSPCIFTFIYQTGLADLIIGIVLAIFFMTVRFFAIQKNIHIDSKHAPKT